MVRFGSRRRARRSNVQVRGCGCCLPIPLGVFTVFAGGATLLGRELLSRR